MTDCEAPKGGDRGRKQSSLAQKNRAHTMSAFFGWGNRRAKYSFYTIYNQYMSYINCLFYIFLSTLCHVCLNERGVGEMGAAIYKEIRAHLPPLPNSSQHLGNCSSGTLCSGRSLTSKQEENEGSNFLCQEENSTLLLLFFFCRPGCPACST